MASQKNKSVTEKNINDSSPLIKQHDTLNDPVSGPYVSEEGILDEEPPFLPLGTHQPRAEIVTPAIEINIRYTVPEASYNI